MMYPVDVHVAAAAGVLEHVGQRFLVMRYADMSTPGGDAGPVTGHC